MGDDDSNGANPTTEPAIDQTSNREGVALPHNSATWKVLGEISALDGIGVLGHNTNESGTNKGVAGVVDSDDVGASGVHGRATGPSDRTYGVRGETESDNSFAAGVKGVAHVGEGTGVVADSTSGNGTAVRALSNSLGRPTIQATQETDGTAILAENFGTSAPVLDIRPNSSTTSEGFGIDCGGTVNVAGQFFLTDRPCSVIR